MSDMARIMLVAPSSGSGKTMLTCGILAALKNRQLHIAAMKCGPDYIDPMFHRSVLGINTGNLDSYFMSRTRLCACLARKAKGKDITILEGVMGYYDGLGGTSTQASSYEIARLTNTRAILIVDCKGASVTLAATIKGIVHFREDSNIAGIILNRISESYYIRLKEMIEKECGVPVLGYMPNKKDMEVPSRHLGLCAPEELAPFVAWSNTLAALVEKTIDIDRILRLAKDAEPLAAEDIDTEKEMSCTKEGRPVIAVARDEAFRFYYDENIELLRQFGAEIRYFSPMHDFKIPEEADGLILGGGYPELYAKQLSDNVSMRTSIYEGCKNKLPCIAECGGFLYLQRTLEDEAKNAYAMCGVLDGAGYKTEHLQRFGYIEAKLRTPGMLGALVSLRGHEFHYWDCTKNGVSALAHKAMEPGKVYECLVHTDTMFAGFPHFHYYSNKEAFGNFVKACAHYKRIRKNKSDGQERL